MRNDPDGHPDDPNNWDDDISPCCDAYDAAEQEVRALKEYATKLEGRLARIGKGCMLAIECVEAVSYWNGMKQVSAYEAFKRYWLSNLQADDMTYLRGLMGIPEPNTPEGKAWMEASR